MLLMGHFLSQADISQHLDFLGKQERSMSRIGCARVSFSGQSLDVQLDKLSDCDLVFQEKQSGRSADGRYRHRDHL